MRYIQRLSAALVLGIGATSPAMAADVEHGGVYQLRAAHSGKCVDVSQVSRRNGQRLHQWACLGRKQRNQHFEALSRGRGIYQLRAIHSGKCITVAGASKRDGAAVQQWPCQGKRWRHQLFGAYYVKGGYFQFRALHSGKCLDVSRVSTANGAAIHQWRCLGTRQRNQLFRPVKLYTISSDPPRGALSVRPLTSADMDIAADGHAAWLYKNKQQWLHIPIGRKGPPAYIRIAGRLIRFRLARHPIKSGKQGVGWCEPMLLLDKAGQHRVRVFRSGRTWTMEVRKAGRVARVTGLRCSAGD